MAYRKFDISIKRKIAETKNVNLFPKLQIPRSTAQYWISNSKELSSMSVENSCEVESVRNETVQSLKLEIEIYRSIIRKIIGSYDFSSLKGTDNKKFIVELVTSLKEAIPKSSIIRKLGMSTSKYYRWEAEALGCRSQRDNCRPILPHQLSLSEQKVMLKLAHDKKLAHLSIKSLMYHGQREGLIFRGYDTWLKYLKLNGIRRRGVYKRKKQYAEGIRAKRANQIWHIDITVVRIKSGETYYIQMAVDNFSRLIVGWKISDRKNLNITLKTLQESQFLKPKYLLSDAGMENRASEVTRFLLGSGINQLISRIDVRYSNSIVEAVFRQLKCYIDFQKIQSLKSLESKVAWYVDQHNHLVPHSSLSGATPNEVFFGIFDKIKFRESVTEQRELKLKNSKISYLECKRCIQVS